MARPRKPTALHVLNGNPSKIKNLGQGEPKPAPVIETPKPPAWMNADGKKMWKRQAPGLQRIGLLTEADVESFIMLCQSFGEWVEAVKDIKQNGKYYVYTNKAGAENEVERPVVRVEDKAYARYKSMCTEFGVSPASRTRIEVKPIEGEQDPMEMLLSK